MLTLIVQGSVYLLVSALWFVSKIVGLMFESENKCLGHLLNIYRGEVIVVFCCEDLM